MNILLKISLIMFIGVITNLFAFNSNLSNKLKINNQITKENLKAFQKFFDTLYIVHKYYIDEYNETTLINKSIKGLMENLDPHTIYLSPKKFKQLKNSSNGNYVGIGVMIEKTKDNKIKIIKVFKDSPSYKEKIRTGDIIVKIKDKLLPENISLEEVVNLIKGKPETNVKITIFDSKTKKFRDIILKRRKINIPTVERKYIKNNMNILYVKINSFSKNEFKELKPIINKYMNNKKIKNKGIIIDLRNNPGGLLTEAVKTLDLFINKGKLVEIKGRNPKDKEVYYAHSKNTYKKVPIVILVNSNSASASEIVSGTMKVNKRAIIVGTKTFGKGSVQIIIPFNKVLGDNSKDAIKLTIAKYYLSNGKSIQGQGVIPDIIVKQHTIKKINNSNLEISENNLDNNKLIKIKSGNVYKENNNNINLKNIDKNKIINKNKDFQLYNAVNILKGLELYKK